MTPQVDATKKKQNSDNKSKLNRFYMKSIREFTSCFLKFNHFRHMLQQTSNYSQINHDILISTSYNAGMQSLPPPLSVSLINVVTIPTSLCPSSVVEYNTLMLEGRKHAHIQWSPSCAHPLCLEGEDMQSVTIIKTKTAGEYRAIEQIKMHPRRHVFLSLLPALLPLFPPCSHCRNRLLFGSS